MLGVRKNEFIKEIKKLDIIFKIIRPYKFKAGGNFTIIISRIKE